MSKQISALVFCCTLLVAPVRADDIWEFVLRDNSSLGRVFMSPAERWQLDQIRRLAPPVTTGASVVDGKADLDAPPKRLAAGYIIPHSGRPSVWRDGEFRKTNADRDLASLHFPDDIKIIRHTDNSGDSSAADGDTVTDTALTAVKSTETDSVQDD